MSQKWLEKCLMKSIMIDASLEEIVTFKNPPLITYLPTFSILLFCLAFLDYMSTNLATHFIKKKCHEIIKNIIIIFVFLNIKLIKMLKITFSDKHSCE